MRRAVDQAPLPAGVADHLGVVALAGDRIGGRVDGAEHVEVDEAVVERRDQRIGHGMGEPREIAVGARRIDDDEIVRLLDRADRLGKAGELDRLVLVELERGSRARRRNAPAP